MYYLKYALIGKITNYYFMEIFMLTCGCLLLCHCHLTAKTSYLYHWPFNMYKSKTWVAKRGFALYNTCLGATTTLMGLFLPNNVNVMSVDIFLQTPLFVCIHTNVSNITLTCTLTFILTYFYTYELMWIEFVARHTGWENSWEFWTYRNTICHFLNLINNQ